MNDIVAVEMGDTGPTTLKGFLSDITERKALETALVDNQNLLRRILHEAPDAMLRVRTDGTILQCNRRAKELFGFSEGVLPGRTQATEKHSARIHGQGRCMPLAKP